MINPFYGEFLVQPFPLDLALNYCSHKCAYCFANLNKPGRKADIPAIIRQVQKRHDLDNLTSRLLREGYPVVMSNKVDPFAASNYQVTLPLLKLFKANKIPVAFQTKGGRGIDDALKLIAPSYWYISIAFQDDAIRKKIEPGAPSIESRWELVGRLRQLGHAVCIGANPLVPEWVPDIPAFLDRLESSGAQGVMAETLHLNNNQTRNMLPREVANMGSELIRRSYPHAKDEKGEEHFYELAAQSIERDIPFLCLNNPFRSDYWEPVWPLYEKLFPVFQHFVNWCHDSSAQTLTKECSYSDFRHSLKGTFPEGHAHGMDYLGATAPKLKAAIPQIKGATYEQFLEICWQIPSIRTCPRNVRCFQELPKKTDSGVQWVFDIRG